MDKLYKSLNFSLSGSGSISFRTREIPKIFRLFGPGLFSDYIKGIVKRRMNQVEGGELYDHDDEGLEMNITELMLLWNQLKLIPL